MIMDGRRDPDGLGDRIDLSPYLAAGGDDAGEPPMVRLRPRWTGLAPARRPLATGPGRCRRPVEGRVAGYLVERTAAVAGELDDVDEDGDGPPWSVGDVADVYPMREPSRACGRCWACRLPRAARVFGAGGRVVAAVRRRSVTVAVVALMVGPTVVFVVARWVF